MPTNNDDPWRLRQIVVHKNSLHAAERWELTGGVRVFGKTVRKYFAKKSDALKKARELVADYRAHGRKASELSDTQRVDAVKAFELIGGKRISLQAAVDFYFKHGPKGKKGDVKTAVMTFLETRGVSLLEFEKPGKHRCIEARGKTYKGYSWKHRVDLAYRLRPFVKRWGGEPLGVMALKRTELQSWLQEEFANLTTLDNHRRTIHSFFSWAISQNLAAENPAKRWRELSRQLKVERLSKKPGILTVKDQQTLLQAAQAGDRELIAYFAIGAFSGIRTEELSGLEWSMIKKEFIHVPASLAKTSEARDIPIHPTLMTWLGIVHRGKEADRVLPADFEKRRRAICKKEKIKWPANALRHGFGSYRYAHTGDIAQTACEMRHEDPGTFRRHYLNRGISKEEAEQYWALKPIKAGKKHK
jgi:integrase